MANNGPKFASVNLNKSYGQPHHFPHYNGGSGAGRGRSVGGSSGNMVVLSRNRGMAPKVVPKLSIPPPLNLPSLRKEHEKYDMLGPGGSGVGVGNSGGSRPTSSSVGWTKPTATVAEKNTSGVDTPGALVDPMVGAGVISGSYMPPLARTGAVGVMSSVSWDIHLSADKAIVLRGEDFPTLQAARPVSSGTGQKQMDLKQKHVENEDLNMGRKSSSDSQQSGLTSMNKAGSHVSSSMKNGEYLPDPLPLVRMTPRSDWADDERDTGHGFVEHERETGFQKSENYWDRDFDFPRPSFPPYKPIHRQYERRGRDSEAGNTYSSEVRKIDAYNRDLNEVNQEGKEVDKWRPSSLSRDGSQETAANYGVDVRRRMTAPGNILKENKYIPPHHGDASRDANNTGNRESLFGRRDLSSVGRQHPNNSVGSFNNPRNDRVSQEQHLSDHNSRFRGDNYQHNSFSNPLVGSSGKMGPMVDPIMTMGRDKRFLRSDNTISEGKPPLRDISAAVFDEKDVFLGDVVGIIKRKKDATKITDIHDPVRESFEAELERVQKMQELERQRIVEEQERWSKLKGKKRKEKEEFRKRKNKCEGWKRKHVKLHGEQNRISLRLFAKLRSREFPGKKKGKDFRWKRRGDCKLQNRSFWKWRLGWQGVRLMLPKLMLLQLIVVFMRNWMLQQRKLMLPGN